MFYRNKSGQLFVSFISLVLATIIYILASPILSDIILMSVPGMGTATAFFVKLGIWLILLVLIAYFLQVFNSGGGFFTK